MNHQKKLTLSILLPVRNEGINLKIMLQILNAVVEESHEVLVIHDEEKDDSIAVVKKIQKQYTELKIFHNQLGNGVLNAIKTGVNNAKGDYILIFAADEVGPVLAIEDMLYLMNKGCSFVSCTRYKYGGKRLGGSIIGAILSRLANKIFHFIVRSPFSDATTGIKIFKKNIFNNLDLKSKPVGWAVAFEMAIKAQFLDIKLGEVPIISIDRLYGGKSTFKLGPWVKEYLKWFLWGWGQAYKHRAKKKPHIEVKIPKFYR